MPGTPTEHRSEISQDLMGSPGTSRRDYRDIEATRQGGQEAPVPFGNRFKHYAAFAVSKKPMDYLRSLKMAESARREGALLDSESLETTQQGEAGRRFRAGAQQVVDAVYLRETAQDAVRKTGANRFAAVVNLEQIVESHPHKSSILKALKKRADKDYAGFADHLANELFLLGQKVFDTFTPKQLNTHTPFFTIAFIIVLVVVFFYMAAEYPRYEIKFGNIAEDSVVGFGPGALSSWIVKSGSAREFDSQFLIKWGGRYAPRMKSASGFSRWFTSLLLHLDFHHIINNLVLFFLFATHLEHKYGTWRITLLTLLAGIGGNFLSAAFEEICLVVVGASGCCFGLIGLFVADMALNFETVSFPILRGVLIIIFGILNLWTAFSSKDTSNLSHLGGFLTGLFPSFIFLPNLKWEKYEASFPFLGVATLLIFYVALPMYLYMYRIPDAHC